MTIHVNIPDGPHFRLPVPVRLLFHPFVWKHCLKYIPEGQALPYDGTDSASLSVSVPLRSLTAEQAAALAKELRLEFQSLRRRFGRMALVDVDLADGTKIKIIL